MVVLKSDREIELMRQAADLVSRTLAEVGKIIEPGVTTSKLDAIAEEFIRDNGAEPAFKGYKVGSLVFPATLCISMNDEVVHGIPGDYELQDGDLASVDCGVVLNGYYGDSAYTFGIGEISDEDAELCRVTLESLKKGVEQTVAGKRVGDISYAIQTHCESHGFGVVKDLVGHGIGRKMHEPPQIPNFGDRGSGKKLKKGMVLCIEPMINRDSPEVVTDADGWTVRTADGQSSAHYEQMVAIGSKGPIVLTSFDYITDVRDAPYNQPVQ